MVGTTWKRAVADELARLYRPGQQFTLTDFYAKAEARLQAMYPDNTEVQATIRQILQRHRDAGLLTFHGNGTYTYNGSAAPSRRAAEAPSGLARAAYELAGRITAETAVPAPEYLAVARAGSPETELRKLLLAASASKTFVELFNRGRLDLSFERLVIDTGPSLGLDFELLRAAHDRLEYFSAAD